LQSGEFVAPYQLDELVQLVQLDQFEVLMRSMAFSKCSTREVWRFSRANCWIYCFLSGSAGFAGKSVSEIDAFPQV
jgi:hypothetical protein